MKAEPVATRPVQELHPLKIHLSACHRNHRREFKYDKIWTIQRKPILRRALMLSRHEEMKSYIPQVLNANFGAKKCWSLSDVEETLLTLNTLSTQQFSSLRSLSRDYLQFWVEAHFARTVSCGNQSSAHMCQCCALCCTVSHSHHYKRRQWNWIQAGLFTCRSAANNANISSFMAEDIY